MENNQEIQPIVFTPQAALYAEQINEVDNNVQEQPVQKKRIGKPRTINVDMKEGGTRRYKVNVIYLNNRYKNDPEYRELRKQRGIEYYKRKKEKLGLVEKRNW